MRKFYLQNKDNIIFEFGIDRNLITGINYILLSDINGVLPVGFTNLGEWLDRRYVLSHRLHVKGLFAKLGITSIEDYIPITNCVSLTDTYWVQEVGQNKQWKNVSPYSNPINKTVAEYSFTGKISGKYIAGSPDFSTDGTFPKCWKRVNGKLCLYKAGSDFASNCGNEPYSEVFASQLSTFLGLDAIKYTQGQYKGKDISICECMTNESISLKSFSELTGENVVDFKKLINYVKFNLGKQDCKKLIDMLLLDVLLCNVDRHYGNVGILINSETQSIIGLAPIYDNNLSCIPYYTKDEDIEFYISDIRAKDGRTFRELYNLIKSQYTHKLCVKAKQFKFNKLGIAKADERIEYVQKMLKIQLEMCLGC
jgi:hypothetical protein